MSTTANSSTTIQKKQCSTCSKSGGVMICDGCRKPFCGKHVIEHRQELGGQLDQIMQEYDLLQQEMQQSSCKKSSILETIDEWEKGAIETIQRAAAAARRRLDTLENESREHLKKTFADMSSILRASRDADDFSEAELSDWSNRLKELQSEISTPPTAKVAFSIKSFVRLITIEENKSVPKTLEIPASTSTKTSAETLITPGKNKAENPTSTVSKPSKATQLQEIFFEMMGPVATSEQSLLCTHTGITKTDGYFRGLLAYSGGCHTIRFQIVECQKKYCIFFGCMSCKEKIKPNAFQCPQSVGWFGSNQTYEHGLCNTNCKKHGYNSSKIQVDDIMQLALDCDQRQIRLHNERLNQTWQLDVKITCAPLPWQFLVVLRYAGDSVRILPNIS